MSRTSLMLACALLVALGAFAAPASAQQEVRSRTFTQLVPGMLARVRHAPEPSGAYLVAVWDLLVGPGIQSGAATLPGAAVLEVRAGSGVLAFGGEEVALRPGTVVAVPEGESVTLQNRDEVQGLSLRATLLRARRP